MNGIPQGTLPSGTRYDASPRTAEEFDSEQCHRVQAMIDILQHVADGHAPVTVWLPIVVPRLVAILELESRRAEVVR